MNGVLNASVSAGSSHLAARVTCRPQRISPSAAEAGAGSARANSITMSAAQVGGSRAGRFMTRTLGRAAGQVKGSPGVLTVSGRGDHTPGTLRKLNRPGHRDAL